MWNGGSKIWKEMYDNAELNQGKPEFEDGNKKNPLISGNRVGVKSNSAIHTKGGGGKDKVLRSMRIKNAYIQYDNLDSESINIYKKREKLDGDFSDDNSHIYPVLDTPIIEEGTNIQNAVHILDHKNFKYVNKNLTLPSTYIQNGAVPVPELSFLAEFPSLESAIKVEILEDTSVKEMSMIMREVKSRMNNLVTHAQSEVIQENQDFSSVSIGKGANIENLLLKTAEFRDKVRISFKQNINYKPVSSKFTVDLPGLADLKKPSLINADLDGIDFKFVSAGTRTTNSAVEQANKQLSSLDAGFELSESKSNSTESFTAKDYFVENTVLEKSSNENVVDGVYKSMSLDTESNLKHDYDKSKEENIHRKFDMLREDNKTSKYLDVAIKKVDEHEYKFYFEAKDEFANVIRDIHKKTKEIEKAPDGDDRDLLDIIFDGLRSVGDFLPGGAGEKLKGVINILDNVKDGVNWIIDWWNGDDGMVTVKEKTTDEQYNENSTSTKKSNTDQKENSGRTKNNVDVNKGNRSSNSTNSTNIETDYTKKNKDKGSENKDQNASSKFSYKDFILRHKDSHETSKKRTKKYSSKSSSTEKSSSNSGSKVSANFSVGNETMIKKNNFVQISSEIMVVENTSDEKVGGSIQEL